MRFNINDDKGIEILGIFKGEQKLKRKGFSNELFEYLIEKQLFEAELGETYLHLFPEKDGIIFLGLGEENELSIDGIRKTFFDLGKKLEEYKIQCVKMNMFITSDLSHADQISAIVEGILQSRYKFDKYLTSKAKITNLKEFNFIVDTNRISATSQAISEMTDQMEGIFLARDLVNEPAIVMNPTELTKRAKEKLGQLGVEVNILGRDEIHELGMEAFLTVSRGSVEEPKLLIMKWEGDASSDECIAFVGKGLTYDSGGYCIKGSDAMCTMKSDMAGAASVIGSMYSIAKSKVKSNVIAVVATCENMISGEAYKSGDIIGSMSGKTIEIVNTDAEGRLTLADALWYTKTVLNPSVMVDLATLTYSTIAALGYYNSAAITNSPSLLSKVRKAAIQAGEPIWELPNDEDYKKINRSDFADFRNDDRGNAGAIAAGLFLGEFVGNTPWVHLDIAGTAYTDSPRGYLPLGATGIHVKTLYRLTKLDNS